MKKKFIKMNDGKNYLSLGNIINIIKKHSKVEASGIQKEVFCGGFNINDIKTTTVNNYLIGYRPIGIEYKKIYLDLKENYSDNPLVKHLQKVPENQREILATDIDLLNPNVTTVTR